MQSFYLLLVKLVKMERLRDEYTKGVMERLRAKYSKGVVRDEYSKGVVRDEYTNGVMGSHGVLFFHPLTSSR